MQLLAINLTLKFYKTDGPL